MIRDKMIQEGTMDLSWLNLEYLKTAISGIVGRLKHWLLPIGVLLMKQPQLTKAITKV